MAQALKRRQEAVEIQKRVHDEARQARLKYLDEASGEGRGRRWEIDEERERQREETLALKDKEREIDAIRVRHREPSLLCYVLLPFVQARYLGGERKKRKMRRLADRKFVFTWDAGEDTSTDFNPM